MDASWKVVKNTSTASFPIVRDIQTRTGKLRLCFLCLHHAFFFRKNPTPAEIVQSFKKNVALMLKLQKLDTPCEKVAEEVSKNLSSLRKVLCGTFDKAPQTEAVAQLTQDQELLDLLITLIGNLQKIDFEVRKDVASVFCSLVECTHTVEYIRSHPKILSILLKGAELVHNYGMMLRACLRHEPLARMVLCSRDFYLFFPLMGLSMFDISYEAFISFKDLLTRHESMSAKFLETNYDKVFEEYEKLLHSDNYDTRRQSLQLLGELLLNRHNFSVMTRYISSAANLRSMMHLLRANCRLIQFEAFKVFKVFVENPYKPVLDILLKNKTKLVELLSRTDQSDDDQFCYDKLYLIKQIRDLKHPTAPEEPKGDPPESFH